MIDNSLIYPLKFGFRQNYSIVDALSNVTENIRRDLDEYNIGSDIFVDLKNVFDTVEHNTRLWKLEHYGIGGFANEWFES